MLACVSSKFGVKSRPSSMLKHGGLPVQQANSMLEAFQVKVQQLQGSLSHRRAVAHLHSVVDDA